MKKRKGVSRKIVVAAHGGFDPLHIGHVRYLESAKKLGDELVVILNNNNWLQDKKGFVFMPEQERKAVLLALRAVDRVIISRHTPGDEDRTISKEIARLKPDIFVNGGDSIPLNKIAEKSVCDKYGIKIVVNVGRGGKMQSSSRLVKKTAGAVVSKKKSA